MEVTIISRGIVISIARGVAETEDALITVTFILIFIFNLAYLLFLSGLNAQLCSSHGVRYNGLSTKQGPYCPKPPTTVHLTIPKLKPFDPA